MGWGVGGVIGSLNSFGGHPFVKVIFTDLNTLDFGGWQGVTIHMSHPLIFVP